MEKIYARKDIRTALGKVYYRILYDNSTKMKEPRFWILESIYKKLPEKEKKKWVLWKKVK